MQDPVFWLEPRDKSGDSLLHREARQALIDELAPLSYVITPPKTVGLGPSADLMRGVRLRVIHEGWQIRPTSERWDRRR